jgi:hypothetical protein
MVAQAGGSLQVDFKNNPKKTIKKLIDAQQVRLWQACLVRLSCGSPVSRSVQRG